MYYGVGQLYLDGLEVCCNSATLSVSFDSNFKSLRTRLRKVGQIEDVKRTSIEHILNLEFSASSNALLNVRTGGSTSETGVFNSLNYSVTLPATPLEQISSNFYSNWVETVTGTVTNPSANNLSVTFEGLFYNVNNEKLFLQTPLLLIQTSEITTGNFNLQYVCIEPKLLYLP